MISIMAALVTIICPAAIITALLTIKNKKPCKY